MAPDTSAEGSGSDVAAGWGHPTRRLPRAQRREQIILAATRAFASAGFMDTSLDDVAAAAGISRVILYRHFDSKADLYRAVLERCRQRLANTVGTDRFTKSAIPALLRAAAADPDGFRLLFRHASREPEFRDFTDALARSATEVAYQHLIGMIPDHRWATWAARLVPVVATEAVIAWLDAGQPDPDTAPGHVARAVGGVIEAALSGNEVPVAPG
ncbi:MAG TPA: TetR/AcrR family transcriptional regulator [Micromonosporaceae bacterium]|jgi:AcrR family transcriptional regulator|nr:TetR/AcrR family transcriptional regulator [Micromonosporaceae bacterium]